jgi:putative oxidoreductase
MTFLIPFEARAYALLRIVSGFCFTFHGVQKIFGIWTDHHPVLFSQIWIGGMIELLGGLMIMIGFRTRVAAFISSGTMAVAYAQFHWKFQFDQNFLPGMNDGELAAIYAFVFLLIACRGAGIWAADRER